MYSRAHTGGRLKYKTENLNLNLSWNFLYMTELLDYSPGLKV